MEPVTAHIQHYEKSRQGHVVYTLEVSFRGTVWQLQKRFNDFLNMNQQLKREVPRADTGQPPERRFFGRFEPDFLQQRSQELQQLLDRTLAHVPLSDCDALVDFLELPNHVAWEPRRRDGSSGSGDHLDRSNKEAQEQERLAALVEETAKALIDVSRTGVEPQDPGETAAAREKLLRACDGFKSHAGHLKNFFKPRLPASAESVSGHGPDSVLETLNRPPSIPADEQKAVLERCSILIVDYLREVAKIQTDSISGIEGDLVCFMQGGARGGAEMTAL